jgi:hypothetical protein
MNISVNDIKENGIYSMSNKKENYDYLTVNKAKAIFISDEISLFAISKEKLFENYSNEISSLFEKIIFNLGQIQTLENLRDTLLPKLLSGEVKL